MEKEQGRNKDEIDLAEIAREVWSKRRFITRLVGVFFILGLTIALTSKVEYEASCKLLPETAERTPDFGGLGGLAGLAGVDLSGLGGQGVLSPDLYPEIVSSVPFTDKMINSTIYFENIDTTISSFNYFKEIDSPSLLGFIAEYSIGLPGKVKRLLAPTKGKLKDIEMIRYSKDDWKIMESFSDRLSVSVDSKTGIISVKTEMPDAVASAKTAVLLVKELTLSVTNYKIEKASVNLDFIKERFDESKREYEKKQDQIARFSDRNRNISNSIVNTEYERLQNELDIAFEVYKGLATQLEQAKIKVKEETPVFTILEPVMVPSEKSKPRSILIIIGMVLLGGILGSSIVLIRIIGQNVFDK